MSLWQFVQYACVVFVGVQFLVIAIAVIAMHRYAAYLTESE